MGVDPGCWVRAACFSGLSADATCPPAVLGLDVNVWDRTAQCLSAAGGTISIICSRTRHLGPAERSCHTCPGCQRRDPCALDGLTRTGPGPCGALHRELIRASRVALTGQEALAAALGCGQSTHAACRRKRSMRRCSRWRQAFSAWSTSSGGRRRSWLGHRVGRGSREVPNNAGLPHPLRTRRYAQWETPCEPSPWRWTGRRAWPGRHSRVRHSLCRSHRARWPPSSSNPPRARVPLATSTTPRRLDRKNRPFHPVGSLRTCLQGCM